MPKAVRERFVELIPADGSTLVGQKPNSSHAIQIHIHTNILELHRRNTTAIASELPVAICHLFLFPEKLPRTIGSDQAVESGVGNAPLVIHSIHSTRPPHSNADAAGRLRSQTKSTGGTSTGVVQVPSLLPRTPIISTVVQIELREPGLHDLGQLMIKWPPGGHHEIYCLIGGIGHDR